MADSPAAFALPERAAETFGLTAPSPRRRWFRRSSTGSPAVAPSARRRPVNRRRAQFSLLVVRGDGVRVVRFNFVRPLAVAGALTLAVSLSTVGVLLRDWLHLRQVTRDAVTFAARIDEQRRTIEDFNRRVAALRKEVGSWQELHARIEEPFGPAESGRTGRDRGIGGATTASLPISGVSASDELNRLTETLMREGENLRALDRVMMRAGKAIASLPSRWPVHGSVNSEFGNRKSPWTSEREFHAGLDIGANRGTPVQAPAAGTVVFAGTAPEYGTAVILDHGQEVKSLYGHLSQVSVKVGQKVERGGLIAYTGNTGRSSGPHLHYEVIVKGRPVNPRAYLWN
jgi:murein DD-endopeptidase MepM/ murein hydrolase activator NlpD